MNKTYQELCDEVVLLREQLQAAQQKAADYRQTLEQMEAEEGEEIADLKEQLDAAQMTVLQATANALNSHNRCKELEAELEGWKQTAHTHHECEEHLARKRDAMAAQLKKLITAVRKWEGLNVTAGSKAAELVEGALRIALEPIEASLAHHDADVIASLRFPTMLRQMWSGGEVQRWLDQQADEKRPAACPACGSRPGQYHAPECPAVDAFAAGRIANRGGE